MRSATLFASLLLYAILATSLPQPLRPRDRKSFSLPMNVRLPKSNTQFEANRHRARALAQGEPLSMNITNAATAYTASVGVGSPPTFYTLDVDTGSSNTWIGAIKPYVPTSTSKPTGQNVSVSYGTGSFNGSEFIDQLTFGNGPSFQQSIGVATSASVDFTGGGLDGILGLGPSVLTIGNLSPNVNDSIPTVVDSLFGQGLISRALIGISFEPVVGDDRSVNVTGEIDFGGVDLSKTTSDIVFTPITQNPLCGLFWGIDASIRLGDTEILALNSGIVDTGTTEVLLSTPAFQQYVNATGATLNETSGALTVTKDQFLQIPSLKFIISGVSFEMTPDAQASAQNSNLQPGSESEDILLTIGDLGDIGTEGLNFIMGYAMLERYYSVYDSEFRRVGFAMTPHTYDVVNVPM